MRKPNFHRGLSCLAIGAAVSILAAGAPLFSSARSVSTSVNIVNNSSRTIAQVYLSPVNIDNWSGNQIGDAISPGQSRALDVECSQGQIKVIGEDQDGCFVTTVITCGEGSTWTVSDATPRDCGS